MTQTVTPVAHTCPFCAIASGKGEASVVHQDETAVAFMDRYPVTPGHLLVIPRQHVVGLEDLDTATGAHVWSLAHDLARALRRSRVRCEGINLLLCDGQAAFQTVFHLHLHVIPRYAGDGWTIDPETHERGRPPLDADAQAIRDVLHRRAEARLTAAQPQ